MTSSNQAFYRITSHIPYPEASNKIAKIFIYLKSVGIYGYRADVLQQITNLPISTLEKAESLEQLRWIENGYRIKVAETELETYAIDTPEDLLNLKVS